MWVLTMPGPAYELRLHGSVLHHLVRQGLAVGDLKGVCGVVGGGSDDWMSRKFM